MKSHWRLVCSLSYGLITALSLYAGFALRFDFSIPRPELHSLWIGLAIAVPLKVLIFCQRRRPLTLWWHYAGIADVPPLVSANLLASACFTGLILLMIGPEFPRSIYFLDPIICFLLTAGLLFA